MAAGNESITYGSTIVYQSNAGKWQQNEAYRTITFTSPVSVSDNKDFVTWFKANAVKLVPISGTWVFNETPSLHDISSDSINATCAQGDITDISAYTNRISYTFYSDGFSKITNVYTSGAWTNQAYRTITFTDTQMVPKDFYQWFTANAKPLILAKGTIINMNLDGNGDKTYRVLAMNGNVAKLLGMSDIATSQKFNTTSKTGTFTNGATGQLYAGSDLDTYLNTTWYNTLTSAAKAAIVPESRTQYMYQYYDEPNTSNTPTYTYQYQDNWSDSNYENADLTDSILVGDRNVFALDLKDIFDYFGKVCITSNELVELWTNQTSAVNRYWWLTSADGDYSDFAWSVYGGSGCLNYGDGVGNARAVRPAFQIDLSKIIFTTSAS